MAKKADGSQQLMLPVKARPLTLIHNGHEITADEDRMVDMTAMWRAEGEPANKDPRRWADTEQAKGFIESLAQFLNVAKNVIWKSKRGKHLSGAFGSTLITG